MAERYRHRRIAPALALACAGTLTLVGCGNTGDLYLPETGSTGEIVTRPAQTPPAEPNGNTSSPGTVDSPSQPANPAPEVTAPPGTTETTPQQDRKKDGAATPPR